MRREDAAALLDAFRERGDAVPPVDPYVLANAHLKVLGSLAPEKDAFSK